MNSLRMSPVRRLTLGLTLAAAFFAIAGCDNDKDKDPPAELVDIKPKLNINHLWSSGLGGKSERLRLALRPVVADGVVYAAGHKGEVEALQSEKGKQLWSVKTKLALSAGPEVGAGVVVLGSSDGDIIVLDATNGAQKWKKRLANFNRRSLC